MEKVEEKIIKVKPIKTEQIRIETESALDMLNSIEQVEITSHLHYDNAADMLRQIKAKTKELDAKRKEITGPLDMAKKAVMDLFRLPLNSLEKGESLLKKGMLDFAQKEEAKRKEREEKLRKQAEAERLKKEAQQRAWEEKERKAREEAERLAAEGKEEEAKKAEERAEKAMEKAEEREIEASAVQAPILAETVNKTAGVSCREIWSAEVLDLSKVPVEYLLPNMPMLNKVAQATKGRLSLPGVQFVSKKILASRS